MNTEKAIDNLIRRGFETRYFATKGEAADYLCENLRGTTVGIGGSMTVEAMDVFERLKQNNKVFWNMVERGDEVLKGAAASAVYISGANAVSETGEIVNVDGRGNRVAATLFGKERVIFVTGTNKLEPDLESAIYRARNVASPKNAQRLGKNTPCAKNGDKCYDCNSKERICNGLVVHMGKMSGVGSMEVILIGEELGY